MTCSAARFFPLNAGIPQASLLTIYTLRRLLIGISPKLSKLNVQPFDISTYSTHAWQAVLHTSPPTYVYVLARAGRTCNMYTYIVVSMHAEMYVPGPYDFMTLC
jgi:hypothetical protein